MGCSQSKSQQVKSAPVAARREAAEPVKPSPLKAQPVTAAEGLPRNDSLSTAPSPTQVTTTFVSDSARIQDNITQLLESLGVQKKESTATTSLQESQVTQVFELLAADVSQPLDQPTSNSPTNTEPAAPFDCHTAFPVQEEPLPSCAATEKKKKNKGNRKQKRVDVDVADTAAASQVKSPTPIRGALQPTGEINVVVKSRVTFTPNVEAEEQVASPNKRRKNETNRGKGKEGGAAANHGKSGKAKVKAPKFKTTGNIRQDVYATQLAAFQRLLTDVTTLGAQLNTR